MLAARCTRHAFRPVSRLSRPLGNALSARSRLFDAVTPTSRTITSTPRHRKDDPRDRILQQTAGQKTDVVEGIKPETVTKDAPPQPVAPAKDPLLAEKTMSNKEQRKADWAIIKEMSKYLWPKVTVTLYLRLADCRKHGLTNVKF